MDNGKDQGRGRTVNGTIPSTLREISKYARVREVYSSILCSTGFTERASEQIYVSNTYKYDAPHILASYVFEGRKDVPRSVTDTPPHHLVQDVK